MKKNINVISRLQAYFDLKEGVIQEIKHSKNIQRGFLTASLPLLTVGAAIAQCQGAQATNLTLGEGTAAGLRIDVNGDGNDDFIIYERDVNAGNDVNLMFDRLGSGTMTGGLTNGGSGTIKNYNLSEAVNGGGINEFSNVQWLAWKSYGVFGGNFSGPYPTSGYIGIKMGTSYGFIQLTVESGPVLGNENVDYVISVAEAGLQNANQNVLAGNCSTLPVELTSFTIKTENKAAHLEWETVVEVNNAGFEVERSIDGSIFKHIGFVEGIGNSNKRANYDFEDKGLVAGNSYYYRLKQIDYNGRYEYSDVVEVTIAGKKDIVGDIYPNPANKETVYIDINAEKQEFTNMEVIDINGRVVHSQRLSIAQSASQLRIPTGELANGTYFVKVSTKNESYYKRLMVQK